MLERDRKKMLAKQATAMLALLWRSAFFTIAILISAIIAIELVENEKSLPKFVRYYAGTFMIFFFLGVPVAFFFVLKAMTIINESSVSKRLNDQASKSLETAKWLMLIGITLAATIISLFILAMVSGIEPSPSVISSGGLAGVAVIAIILVIPYFVLWIIRKFKTIMLNFVEKLKHNKDEKKN